MRSNGNNPTRTNDTPRRGGDAQGGAGGAEVSGAFKVMTTADEHDRYANLLGQVVEFDGRSCRVQSVHARFDYDICYWVTLVEIETPQERAVRYVWRMQDV